MNVRWTVPAANDLTQIHDYTENRFGVTQARRAATMIYGAVDALKDMPLRGRAGRKPGTQELIVSGLPFVIVYRVLNEAVEVIRILHGSQKRP